MSTPVKTNQEVRVFVAGLPANVTASELTRRFAAFGEIVGCDVIPDKNIEGCRGFAYVQMKTSEEKLNKCFSVVRARQPDSGTRAGFSDHSPGHTLILHITACSNRAWCRQRGELKLDRSSVGACEVAERALRGNSMRVERAKLDYKTKLANQWRDDVRNEQQALDNARQDEQRAARELPTSTLKEPLNIVGRNTYKVRNRLFVERWRMPVLQGNHA
eukprot:3484807-Pyramimonas_sp.AAC.2